MHIVLLKDSYAPAITWRQICALPLEQNILNCGLFRLMIFVQRLGDLW